MSIAACMYPSALVQRYFAPNSEYGDEDRMRIAHQFADVDHGSRGESDWKDDEDNDALPWLKFYRFCYGFVHGFIDIQALYYGRVVPVKAFRVYRSCRWYPVDLYIAESGKEIYLDEKAVKGEMK